MKRKSLGKNNESDDICFPLFTFDSRAIWEINIAMIRKHNLEADLGLFTYTLGINRFSDMVGLHCFFFCFTSSMIHYLDE